MNNFIQKHLLIIEFTISIISIVLVFCTLLEMKIARNATYCPDIVFNTTEIAIAWDKYGNPYISSPDKKDILNIIDSNTPINQSPKIKIYNIGVGTAKKITLKWDDKANIQQFNKILHSYDDINIILENDMVCIKNSMSEQHFSLPNNITIEFLLNSTDGNSALLFPPLYYQLIKEICIRTDGDKLPTLNLKASFSDIQGKTYNTFIQINCQFLLMTKNPDGSGFCILNLIPSKETNTMSFFDFFNLNNESLLSITSICAVIISILSFVLTCKVNNFQIEHNKNSIKPISAIKFNDYEDDIAVKIQNVGTGPLIIKKLIFKKGERIESDLISLMPPINQPYSTYTESVDGWTIPVGGQLVLLRLTPTSSITRQLIRKELCKITAYLDYADIYNTMFHDERSFDFFGRHYKS